MNLQRAAGPAALLALLLCSGCTLLTPGSGAPAAESAAPARTGVVRSAADEQQTSTLGVSVEIVAPPPLQALLERHLDLVRLGAMTRVDIDDTEWSRLIDATPAQVAELLQTEGFFKPQVTLGRAPGRAAGQPDIVRLEVDPGPRARVSRVTIEAQGDLEREAAAGEAHALATLEALRRKWQLPAGQAFRNPDWNSAKSAALGELRAAGYANATWAGSGAEIDVANNEVRLFLVAESGPLFRFGELQIEGLVAHDAQTVAHLADMPRGVPVTETLLLDFQERLIKSGLFEGVNVVLDPDPSRAADARIVARLREAPLQVYTFGVGISSNNGPRVSVEHAYRRVFGWAASAQNKIEWAELRQAWDGELSSHTEAGLHRNLIGAAIENQESDSDTVLSVRVRAGRTNDRQRLERLNFVEIERSVRTTVEDVRTEALAISLNSHAVLRRLDNVILPTRGFTLSLQGGVGRSDGTDASPGIFGRAYGRLTVYQPLGGSWYGQARLEAGEIFLREGMVVPESQKWRAGGDDSVRGYDYRSLGPVVGGGVGGGTSVLTASIEVARPILNSMPSLWGALFVDAGNAANGFDELEPFLGAGAGLRWRSPVGPLRLDLAWGQELQDWRLHFSVGIAF
ncbi:MAG: BamA/TamA family outer membrane protein [Betaproteobacteria bacterium]|jgi:translocation and assembly module TamA|nr:BamA/TamA family outer membrane protein [Betaproteobacteria bacterium]MBK7456980.1 BamA/TamA family outer membrane protein [Betaproteobacteria bacterium]